MNNENFNPNWTSPPGHTILGVLDRKDIPIDDFIAQMEMETSLVRDLIDGKAKISRSIADKLSYVLGTSSNFWINRDEQYWKDLQRIQKEDSEAENWLRSLPLSDMRKFGCLSKTNNKIQKIKECLSFFSVSSVQEWQRNYGSQVELAAFRTSPTFEPNIASVATWIRFGEIKASEVKCEAWNLEGFERALPKIKKLTKIKDPNFFIPKLVDICSAFGVAVVICKTPQGCQASGATKFLSEDKALMMLSFRYLSDDQFWFTFFHEAAHLILHGKDGVFIEDRRKNKTIQDEEVEANNYAEDILIDKAIRPELQNMSLDKKSIITFAYKAGVSPGIVVGQLQHIGRIKHSQLQFYKRRYKWNEINL